MNRKLRNTVSVLLFPAALAASPLSDKLFEIESYLIARNFSVEQNASRTFTDPDTSYTFPLLLDENDSNISAGLSFMLATIDTSLDNGKKAAVENNYGLNIVVGVNTSPDSVLNLIRDMPVRLERQSRQYISKMLRNRPNPFSLITNIAFDLEIGAQADMDILNPKGQVIAHIMKRQEKRGSNSAFWNGRNDQGYNVPPGSYFARLKITDRKGKINFRYGRIVYSR